MTGFPDVGGVSGSTGGVGVTPPRFASVLAAVRASLSFSISRYSSGEGVVGAPFSLPVTGGGSRAVSWAATETVVVASLLNPPELVDLLEPVDETFTRPGCRSSSFHSAAAYGRSRLQGSSSGEAVVQATGFAVSLLTEFCWVAAVSSVEATHSNASSASSSITSVDPISGSDTVSGALMTVADANPSSFRSSMEGSKPFIGEPIWARASMMVLTNWVVSAGGVCEFFS